MSVGRQAMSMKGCSIGPMNSVFPDARLRTGRMSRAAPLKRNRPGYGPPLVSASCIGFEDIGYMRVSGGAKSQIMTIGKVPAVLFLIKP